MKSPLREIPGVGERIAAVMEALGIRQVSDLRGRDPEELYRRGVPVQGLSGGPLRAVRLNRYTYRVREDEKLKWWYWKDHPYPPENSEEPQ